MLFRLSAQPANQLWCHDLGTAQGLSSQDFNFYVFNDSEGFTWVSSTKGLNRFDGKNVKQYHSNFQDTTCLFGENIQSNFFEDSNKDIWFCTYKAVHRYNRKHDNFSLFFIHDKYGKPILEDYYVFYLEKNQYLWVRVRNKVYRINLANPGTLSDTFESAQPLITTERFHAFPGASESGDLQYLFFSSQRKKSGLKCYRLKNGHVLNSVEYFDTINRFNIFQVYYEDASKIWFSTDKGMVKWNLEKDSIKIYPFNFNGFSFFTPYGKDAFIITFSNRGVFMLNHKGEYHPFQLRSTKTPEAELTSSVRNIYLDRNKILWVTHPYNGITYAHLNKRKFTYIWGNSFTDDRKPMFKNFIYSEPDTLICSYENGILIMTKQGSLLKNLSQKVLSSFPIEVNHILKDTSGTIWVASGNGLFYLDADFKRIQKVPDSDSIDFLYLFQLQNGEILVSSLSNGVFKILKEKNEWTVKKVVPTQDMGYTSIYEDMFGQIYICRNEAEIDLFLNKGDSLELQRKIPVRGSINSFYEAKEEGVLWIGTSFGLVKLTQYAQKKDSKEIFTINEGLPDNNIQCIIPGNNKELWLSTFKGISYFRKGIFRNFSLADGSVSEQFYPFSGIKLPGEKMWFGGSNGIILVDPEKVANINSSPPVLLTSLKINDEVDQSIVCKATNASNVNQIQHIELPYKKNTLSFNFVVADFSDPEHTTLSYQLEGVDKHPVNLNVGQSGTARYPNLPPGSYVLCIKGTNSDGIAIQNPRKVKITILPPFWQTWWFRSLMALFAIGVITLIVQSRIKRIRTEEQLKTRIAENRMAALVAQMNPHFIFNSLQSINSYILKKERQQASEYLGRFSRLMRMILENSRTSIHPLEKEIDLLKLYLKVEAQRFKVPFNFSIIVDEAIDIYETSIPCMMLQPFVENAIWHGLSNKSSQGHIRIAIKKQKGVIKCVIEDNGIGRKAAAEMVAKKGKSHQSQALEIITERLSLLFPDQHNLCAVSYIDLKDDKNDPSGTRVEITLPFLD